MFMLYVALLKFVRLRTFFFLYKKSHLISEKGTLEIGQRRIHSWLDSVAHVWRLHSANMDEEPSNQRCSRLKGGSSNGLKAHFQP